MIYAKIIFLCLFPVLEAYRDYLIFPVPEPVSKRWHHLGFIIRASVGILLLLPYWQYIPLYACFFWVVFDLLTGVGTTAYTDKYLGKYSIYIKVVGLILSLVLIYILRIW